jgi:transposase
MSTIMNSTELPTDIEECHLLIATLQSQVKAQASEVQKKQTELSLKDNLIEEQAHSVLQVKAEYDKLEEQNTELNLKLEKLLKLIYGRKSERRVDGAGQLFLNLGEEPTPEVVNALEEAIREAQQIVDQAEEGKKKRRRNRPPRGDRKFPEHLPRCETIVDLPEDQREGLVLIGYDEVETLECTATELKVRRTKYVKYAHRADKSQSIVSPERPTGLVEGESLRRLDRSGNRRMEILLSLAVLSSARHVRRQRLDAQSQHAAEHRNGRRVRLASAGRLLALFFETRSHDRLR